MVQESVTKITSEIEGTAYAKRVRDFNLFTMLKKKQTTKPAPTSSFLDCNALIQYLQSTYPERNYRTLEGSLK